MEQGTQIAYIPLHAGGDLDHPDVEFGFVTEERDNAHFCRYWARGHVGHLRTVSNSELTPTKYFVKWVSVLPSHVNKWLKELGY